MIICLSQGREPAENQLHAEHDRGPDRVGPVVLWVSSSCPTANLQINFSGTAGLREHWSHCRAFVCVCVCVCVCARVCVCMYVYVWKQWEADWRNLRLWHTISLWGKNPELNWCKVSLKSNYMADSARTDSDLEWILILIWHFLPGWSDALKEKKKARNPQWRWWWCMSMIKWISVYSHRTMLSYRGIFQIQSRQADVWSVFVPKAQSSLLKTSMCVCMFKTRVLRMFSMFALKDCYWVSPGVFVHRTPEL